MGILNWDKPKKKISTEEWLSISADGAPPGVYVPNMSDKDNLKWKGKVIGGNDPRVEIRKGFHFHNGKKYPDCVNYGAQTLIIIRLVSLDQPNVVISTNGKIGMSFNELNEMNLAIQEAIEVLTRNKIPANG